MNKILDIHTHRLPPAPRAVVSATPEDFSPIADQFYSVGVHPWDTSAEIAPITWDKMERISLLPEVVAIGEAGIDILKGGPLFRQMLVFKRQIKISEQVKKPLIIHDVKAHDIIIGLKKEFNPAMNWAIHGFRNKPTVARMLIEAGLWISFGSLFNADSLRRVPEDRILAETDDSEENIFTVIERLSETVGKDLLPVIARNTEIFLNLNKDL